MASEVAEFSLKADAERLGWVMITTTLVGFKGVVMAVCPLKVLQLGQVSSPDTH